MGDGVLGPVGETVFLSGVAMKVQVHEEVPFVEVLEFPYVLFEIVALGKDELVGVDELAVEVLTTETGAVIAQYHPVRIDHRNYLEYY